MMTFADEILKKTIIQAGLTLPAATANDIAVRQKTRAIYVLKVLNAPVATQTAVKNAALASNSQGQKQLAAILTLFATLSASKKAQFIEAYKRRARITGTIRFIAANKSWSWNQLPPGRFEP